MLVKGQVGMAKKGTKIKQLARELGITSRELITRCREEGMPVQNSVTKITVEMERVIRGWFADGETSKVPPDPPKTG